MSSTIRNVLLAACAVASAGCLKRVPPPAQVPEHRAVKLLGAVREKETGQLPVTREDLEVDTHDMDRTPHVVESATTETIELGNAHARLAGNAEGTAPFEVDNFLLFDVLDPQGKPLSSFVVGYVPGVLRGNQRLDNVGAMRFQFDAGQVDISSHVPANKPFKLQVTALDFGGVGRVTDVYLVMDRQTGSGPVDDLRGE